MEKLILSLSIAEDGRLNMTFDKSLGDGDLLGAITSWMEEKTRTGRLSDDDLTWIYHVGVYVAAATLGASGEKDTKRYVEKYENTVKACMDFHNLLDKQIFGITEKR